MFRKFRYHADTPKNYQSIVVDGYVIVLETSSGGRDSGVEVKIFTPGGREVRIESGRAMLGSEGNVGEGGPMSSHGDIRPVLVAGTRMSQAFTRSISSKQ